MHCKNIDYHSNKNFAIKGPQYNLEITITHGSYQYISRCKQWSTFKGKCSIFIILRTDRYKLYILNIYL